MLSHKYLHSTSGVVRPPSPATGPAATVAVADDPEHTPVLTANSGLLAFALAHARITALMGSRQHTRDNSYVLVERILADYNLIYVWEGGADWIISGTTHHLLAGDLVIVPPGAPHRGHSTTRDMTLGSIHALASLPGGRDLFELLALPRQRRVAAGGRLDRIFRLAMEEYDRPWATAETMVPAWTSLILKELIREDAEAGRLPARTTAPVVAGVLAFIEQHLDEALPLSRIAQHAGYTPQHLNRLFRRDLGATPLACLHGLRMERAALLLREDRLEVQAVALAVGYPDPAYFSRAFRAHHGASPSAYQRTARAP
jgi:AraC-like DNA-binding protein